MGQSTYTVQLGSQSAMIIVSSETMMKAVHKRGDSRRYVVDQARKALGVSSCGWNDLAINQLISLKKR